MLRAHGISTALLFCAMQIAFCVPETRAKSSGWPKGCKIAEKSESPDGRYAVLIPTRNTADADQDNVNDTFVDLKKHRSLGAIRGAVYFSGENHRGLEVTWAPDSSWCIVTYEARFGFGEITLVEPHGATVAQADLGRHIDKALNAVIARQEGTSSAAGNGAAHFRSAPGRKILVRATSQTNPKGFPDQTTYYALFQGTYDLAAGKWTRSEGRKISSSDALDAAYSDDLGENMTFSGEEQKLSWYDGRLNEVYDAVRTVLPPEAFAAVKKEQIAWLKRLEASDSIDKKCAMMTARIKELRRLVW